MPPRKNVGRLATLQRETRVPNPYVLTPEIVIAAPTLEQMRRIRAAANGDESNAVMFGDQWEAVQELFRDQPAQLWDAFMDDVSKHFFGPGVDDVEGKSQDSSES
jgi:hypothetical protein